ncbi:radical SAM protein [Halorhabdus sp. CBA1104]|uniref:radical SAM protein n=1 Tax=Halorhabdus sp. CBA1104 TaxID=1380432 RepID=UPI0012B19595|nr:radical SAM protein [Halorhabdus sp. CBA1104]QGN06735.1 radical SAM protein [Halorhabdus sp. CBA1104]
MDLAYGPVPSRRLGQSLGVNTIPPKTCTYACVYCQLGPTTTTGTDRLEFFSLEEIETAVCDRVEQVRATGEEIDYLSIVPDGEPTLDANLGDMIDRLGEFDIDVAVISNASLLSKPGVRADLAKADWVSLKADAGTAETWRQVDRPNGTLSFDAITRGMELFAEEFTGTLTTETMLVDGLNDDETTLRETAELVATVDPNTAYLAVPTRPPDEEWVEPASEGALASAYSIFDDRLDTVEYLIGAEGASFAATGDGRADILGVTAVHPMQEGGLRELLDRDDADWTVVDALLDAGTLLEREYGGETFYLRPVETIAE